MPSYNRHHHFFLHVRAASVCLEQCISHISHIRCRLYWVNPAENKIYWASLLDGSGVSEQYLSAAYNNIYGVTTMQVGPR